MAIIAEFIELATGLPKRSLDVEIMSGVAEVQVASFEVELQGLILQPIDLPVTLNNQETQASTALFAPVDVQFASNSIPLSLATEIQSNVVNSRDVQFASNSIPLSLATEIQSNVVNSRDVYTFVERFNAPELAYQIAFNSLPVDKLIGTDVSKVVFTGLLTPPDTNSQLPQTSTTRREYWL